MGICEIPSSSGNLVKVYDKERCICDLIKDRKKSLPDKEKDQMAWVRAVNQYNM